MKPYQWLPYGILGIMIEIIGGFLRNPLMIVGGLLFVIGIATYRLAELREGKTE